MRQPTPLQNSENIVLLPAKWEDGTICQSDDAPHSKLLKYIYIYKIFTVLNSTQPAVALRCSTYNIISTSTQQALVVYLKYLSCLKLSDKTWVLGTQKTPPPFQHSPAQRVRGKAAETKRERLYISSIQIYFQPESWQNRRQVYSSGWLGKHTHKVLQDGSSFIKQETYRKQNGALDHPEPWNGLRKDTPLRLWEGEWQKKGGGRVGKPKQPVWPQAAAHTEGVKEASRIEKQACNNCSVYGFNSPSGCLNWRSHQ